MIRRRAAAAGIATAIGAHTFHATGITAYLENGGTLEHAQQIAAHESPGTTKLYDRTSDQITLDEIERIAIRSAASKSQDIVAGRIFYVLERGSRRDLRKPLRHKAFQRQKYFPNSVGLWALGTAGGALGRYMRSEGRLRGDECVCEAVRHPRL